MKLRISITPKLRHDDALGDEAETCSLIAAVTDPEDNFLRHQEEIAAVICKLLPNITASATYDFWNYEILIEGVNEYDDID